MKQSPKEIIEILHSIEKLSVEDGELDTWFKDTEFPMVTREFIPESFTRQLLDLIEGYLLDDTEE